MKHLLYRILAALGFFTRLPFWRIANVPKEYFERVVPLWPLAGWLTGGVMALVFWLCSYILPLNLCLIAAILSRVLLTGALHEDGFADFCDGFGGGGTRERTLQIMKDSHIGTYGVLGLLLYYLSLYVVLNAILEVELSHAIFSCFTLNGKYFPVFIPILFVSADSFSKWSSSNIINVLPYARTEESAKNKLVYSKMTASEQIVGMVLGFLPSLLLLDMRYYLAIAFSFLATLILIRYMYKKIQGYTGDCCGACFIITEWVFLLTVLVIEVW